MTRLTLACFGLLLLACTKHPNPCPVIEKDNGVPTANADDTVSRGEDQYFDMTWDW